MKKTIYTIAILLSSAVYAHAQTAIKETRENIADLFIVGENLVLYTIKEKDGQYLYSERKGDQSTFKKETSLNGGAVNALIGSSAGGNEVYVYQKTGRKDHKIVIYRWDGASFQKAGEKPFPKIKNNSYNLGAYLSPDQNTLFMAADLGRTKGYDDIYLSKWEGGKWSKPTGLGTPPNTREAEFSPYVMNDSLFFSRKSGDQASVYSMPIGGGSKPTGEAVKFSTRVNRENAFNSAYKRVGENEMWITRTADGNYTAYVNGPDPVVSKVELEPAPEPVAIEPAAVPVPTTLTVSYGFNEVYMTDAAAAELDGFLAQLPDGASLWVKGYSDNIGPAKGKVRVAQQRARLLQKYIEMKHRQRSFKFETQSEVLGSRGPEARKVEIHLHAR
ncbi:hypothetical protein [Rufibacter ruber]|uniref:hypothetical protein n=1 Tax=Rufibacter ruber TaxID=1783499 RepID=UPI00083633AE|nr:hypothetical protein [Rufibacter ruber]